MRLPKLDYEGLFHDPRMFNSRSTFIAAGFDVMKQAAPHNIMVGRHPSVDRYLFKKYNRDVPLDEQEENYHKRQRGAEKIQHVIDKYRMHRLAVPKKWIYELPDEFAERRQDSYVLIAERMDILSVDESARRYRTIDTATLDELCIMLFHFKGFDSAIHNLRFTTDGKIAFIDTESWDRSPRRDARVMRRIIEELPRDLTKRVERMFKKLEDDD